MMLKNLKGFSDFYLPHLIQFLINLIKNGRSKDIRPGAQSMMVKMAPLKENYNYGRI